MSEDLSLDELLEAARAKLRRELTESSSCGYLDWSTEKLLIDTTDDDLRALIRMANDGATGPEIIAELHALAARQSE